VIFANELPLWGDTHLKAKCMGELILHLVEEGSLDNLVENRTHEVGRTSDQPSLANDLTEAGTPLDIQSSNDEPRNTSTDLLPQLCTLLSNQSDNSCNYNENRIKGTSSRKGFPALQSRQPLLH